MSTATHHHLQSCYSALNRASAMTSGLRETRTPCKRESVEHICTAVWRILTAIPLFRSRQLLKYGDRVEVGSAEETTQMWANTEEKRLIAGKMRFTLTRIASNAPND